MIEKLKDAFDSIGEKTGISGTAAGVIALITLIVLLAIVIVAIVCGVKKSRKKSAAASADGNLAEKASEANGTSEKAETNETVAENDETADDSETESVTMTEADAVPEAENEAQKEETEENERLESDEPTKEATTDEAAKTADTDETKDEEQKTMKQKNEEQGTISSAGNTQEKEAKTAKNAKNANGSKKAAKGTKAAEKPAMRMLGKWRIAVKGEGAYISVLCASNGEVMLTSEIYSTEDGARNGVATIIKGVETGNFIIYRDKGGDYYYKLKSAGNRLLCVGEIYKTKDGCEKAVETVKRIAKDSPVSAELYEGERFIDYTPAPVTPPAKKAQMGKWKIEQSENGGFSAKLYANNGQLMLSTEEVSARKTAEKAVESVRKNCADGNFFIDKDKFGRFYYKLHNAQNSVICTGETYDTIDGVVSAIESVRRFASNAEIAG